MGDNLIWQLYEYLFSLIESILLFNFLSNTLGKKIKSVYYASGILLYSIIVHGITNLISFSNVKLIVVLFVFFIFAIFMCKDTIKNKMIYTVISFMMLVLCDILIANVMGIIMNINLARVIFTDEWFRVILFCISKLIFFIILKTICNFTGSKKHDLPLKYWCMIIGIFIISLIVLMLIGEIGVLTQDYPNKTVYFIIVSFGVLLINLFMHYILIQLSDNYEKEQLYKIIDIKNEMQNSYYIEREEVYKETRKLGHDFKNHMLCVSSLLRSEKIAEAIAYIDSISETPNMYFVLVKSGNDIMDAVLNQKLIAAQKCQIKLEVNAEAPKLIPIKSADLCAILSNLIDNAMEASIKVMNESKRKVYIKISPYKDYLFISVSNMVEPNEVVDVSRLYTTKNDSRNHGLGTKIVRNVVEKYNGSVEYKFENNLFTVKVLINL